MHISEYSSDRMICWCHWLQTSPKLAQRQLSTNPASMSPVSTEVDTIDHIGTMKKTTSQMMPGASSR